MKSRIISILGLLGLGILSISTGVIFDITFRAINVFLWIGYIILSIFLIRKIPVIFGLTKKERDFDLLRTKTKIRGIVIGIVLFLLSILGGVLIYRSNIVNIHSQGIATRTSKHIKFEQGKPMCISLGEECK